ncbi:hypothetical protein [Paenarthrobacter sp. JL.01a]|uniref:hypothetical protein n=1 Tax=Paenarthrobacter sp. JL.01a TaxID=2979324 RepID=UPI0021C8AFCE|nr:hypothetical protein [Paenarthrobacter sp. JL.01a]UXM93323.1 hypothetical protein N5P29_08455 [Paenarthrobacter sp. JL.01a]
MKRILGVAGAVLLAISLASCGSAGTVANQAESTSPSASPRPTTYYGETASAVAALIPGCTDVKSGDIAKGGPDLASTASCVLDGRTIDVNSWRDSKAIDSMKKVIDANEAEVFYASGTGWTAHPRRDMTFQYQITNQAGELLKLGMSGQTAPAPDLRGEMEVSQKIADALGGKVEHYKP